MGYMKVTSYLFVEPRIFLFSYKIIRYNILSTKIPYPASQVRKITRFVYGKYTWWLRHFGDIYQMSDVSDMFIEFKSHCLQWIQTHLTCSLTVHDYSLPNRSLKHNKQECTKKYKKLVATYQVTQESANFTDTVTKWFQGKGLLLCGSIWKNL